MILRIVVFGLLVTGLQVVGVSSLEQGVKEGENPVCVPACSPIGV